jgi:zinc transporter 1/2/3
MVFFLREIHCISVPLDLSTSYVDRLQAYSSAPQSRDISPVPSRPSSPHPSHDLPQLASPEYTLSGTDRPSSKRVSDLDTTVTAHENIKPTESTPLLTVTTVKSSNHSRSRSKSFSYGSHPDSEQGCDRLFFEGHHRHEPRSAHHSHHSRCLRKAGMFTPPEPPQGSGNGAGHQPRHESSHSSHEADGSHAFDADFGIGHSHGEHVQNVKVGKRRQVVGILVRQVFLSSRISFTHQFPLILPQRSYNWGS